MGMRKTILKITIILPVLLSNALFFGMKRQGTEVATLDAYFPSKRPSITKQQFLDETFDFSTRHLNIEMLKKETVQKNIHVSFIPAYNKIFLLSKNDTLRREHIDKAQAARSAVLRSLPIAEAQLRIKNEFKKIEEQLFDNEIAARNALIQDYNIDTRLDLWRLDMLELRDRVDFGRKLMRQPQNDTTWDPDLPENVVKAFIKSMQEIGVEPTAVNFKQFSDKKYRGYNASFVEPQLSITMVNQLTNLEKYEKNPQKNLFGYKKDSPSGLYCNQNLGNESDDFLIYLAYHEITHMVTGHCQMRIGTIEAIARHAKVKKESIFSNDKYAEWLLRQEITADTLFALENPHTARCAVKARCLHPNSYGLLKTINTNLDVLEFFDKKVISEK